MLNFGNVFELQRNNIDIIFPIQFRVFFLAFIGLLLFSFNLMGLKKIKIEYEQVLDIELKPKRIMNLSIILIFIFVVGSLMAYIPLFLISEDYARFFIYFYLIN